MKTFCRKREFFFIYNKVIRVGRSDRFKKEICYGGAVACPSRGRIVCMLEQRWGRLLAGAEAEVACQGRGRILVCEWLCFTDDAGRCGATQQADALVVQ